MGFSFLLGKDIRARACTAFDICEFNRHNMQDSTTDISSGASVVSLNSMTQASLVVRALRSHKSSRERYQDCSGNTMDVKTLNSAILNVKKEYADQSAKKAEVDRKIDKWSASTTVVAKMSSKDDSDRDDSDEEEQQHRHKNTRTALAFGNVDDDFDFDDDPEENRELFKDFVAPKGNSNARKSSTSSSKSATKSVSSTLQQPSLVTSKGIVIKPGQAIRVKAHGNRSKQGSTSDF